jgi:hypothetical protein
VAEIIYVGLLDDKHGGMTHTGQVVRDAWVFGLIPETETCAGWTASRIQGLYENVVVAWEPYGHLPSRLPPELRERHTRIYEAAIARARAGGWDPELGDDD